MAKRLGDLLLEESLVTEAQIQKAIEEQQKSGEPLGRILVRMGFITEEALYYFLAIQFGTEYVDLGGLELKPEAISLIKKEIAEELNIIPVEVTGAQVIFATSEPDDHLVMKIKERVALPVDKIKFVITSETAMRNALSAYYGVTEKMESDEGMQAIYNQSDAEKQEEADLQEEEDLVNEESAPVIKLVNALISEAVKKRASDIHLNPFQKNMIIRYRIDGVLQTQKSPPRGYRTAIVSRIKVMSRMDIMEKRMAQDGRIKIKVLNNKIIDLRVSVLPTIYGENVVMRILDQESLMLDLSKLGFEKREMDLYKEAIQSPYGLVLHTGPTGSGKTTTLYSALSTINDVAKCIMTLEDPVEYQLPGIIQIQINHDIGFDFSVALRASMRQDPNIMMVGEIRDKETADIAIKSALTGHLLFSTLHTNDSPSTIMRLIDMGVDAVYVGSAVKIIIAQRLMRRICSKCKAPYTPSDDEIQKLRVTRKELEDEQVSKGTGCPACNLSGYKGRVAIYEIMPITPEMSDLIFARADLNDITKQAEKDGMRTLRNVAMEKWRTGITTLEEVLVVTAEGD
jgi:type IV pilus assembly protein PilB